MGVGVGREAPVVELVGGAGGVASQFAQVGWVALVHFLGQAEVVVAADAPSLVLAEENRTLVLPQRLVVLAQPALAPLEVHERLLPRLQRPVDCLPPLLFAACLLQHQVHQHVVVSRAACLFAHHLTHLRSLHPSLFLLSRLLLCLAGMGRLHLLVF